MYLIRFHFDTFLRFLDIKFLFLSSCHHFDMQEQLYRVFPVRVFGCLSIYYKIVLKAQIEFCDCFIFTFYEVIEFISNTLTAQWTHSVGLIFVFKMTCFNWEFMCTNPNFRDCLAILLIHQMFTSESNVYHKLLILYEIGNKS